MKKEYFIVDPKTPGLFQRISSNGIIIISLWVDDFLIAYSKGIAKETKEFITRLSKILLLRKTEGKLLGMELIETENAFYLSSETYIVNKTRELNPKILIEKSKYVSTPLPSKIIILPDNPFDKNLLKEYQQIIGSLIHASNSLRFDITFAVGVLARLVTKVDEKILQYAYRVLNYLYTTKSFKLKFEKKIKQRGREQKAEKNNYKDTNDDFNCDKNINIYAN